VLGLCSAFSSIFALIETALFQSPKSHVGLGTMPFPFKLSTTSSFSFSTYFESNSHPSLPLAASTYRGVVRDSLKKYKRLPPQSQATDLSSLLQCLNNYLPSLFAIDAGLSGQSVAGEEVDIVLKTTPAIEWRPTLSTFSVPGREPPRTKLNSFEYEIYFVLSTLAYIHTLSSRNSLHPLYSTATSSLPTSERTTVITAATKHLLSAASIHSFLSSRSEALLSPPPCVDISTPVFTGLAALALAEATLLAVLKDDPYPAAVAQDRNKNDKEWMIKAPEIPKVRAHLFARLCLAATEHAAKAAGLLRGAKIEDDLVRYVEDLKRVGKAKACRFFGIDAELGGQTGTGIAWLRAGMQELGVATARAEDGKRGLGLGLGRLKREWSEKREERKVDKGAAWGTDAGVAEEGRVLAMLEAKWVKMNDTVSHSTMSWTLYYALNGDTFSSSPPTLHKTNH
jgi:hypothetical protein